MKERCRQRGGRGGVGSCGLCKVDGLLSFKQMGAVASASYGGGLRGGEYLGGGGGGGRGFLRLSLC